MAVDITDTDDINVTIEGSIIKDYVNSDVEFRFNGQSGNTYLKYNSTTSKLELWVNGSKVQEWS